MKLKVLSTNKSADNDLPSVGVGWLSNEVVISVGDDRQLKTWQNNTNSEDLTMNVLNSYNR